LNSFGDCGWKSKYADRYNLAFTLFAKEPIKISLLHISSLNLGLRNGRYEWKIT
jgi:hypothetical protein